MRSQGLPKPLPSRRDRTGKVDLEPSSSRGWHISRKPPCRPHRSDSRSCLARPTRSGPVTKEQLVTSRQASQREFAAVARAKAAASVAKQSATIPPAISTSNQFEDLAQETTLPDAEESGENNPQTHL
ncbi:hypothetical protein K3495_g14030 [Podosphaera aphanis]|nr:hypothetical protein K3495_g14030 [Podosphaera aphanis]